MSRIIKIDEVTKTYKMGDFELNALSGVSLEIESGDFVAIMGPSGSGKSTLMNVLGLLDTPTSGRYELEGSAVEGLSENELAVVRRETIGFIFQQFHLLPRTSALQNVAMPLLYSERALNSERALALLNKVGLSDRESHKTNELSGGQQQRVAIARALINRPRIIFADEPTGNLDSKSEKEIMAMLKELNDSGITVIMVTHEEEIGQEANRLIRMRDGQIVSDERKSPIVQPEYKGEHLQHLKHGTDIIQDLKVGISALTSNKVRSFLSMLGILIGVASVITMLGLGKGATESIKAQLSTLGSNLLVLRSGARRSGGVMMESGSVARLTSEDATTLTTMIPAIRYSSAQVRGRGQITYRNKNWSSSIYGSDAIYEKIHDSKPVAGRFFTDLENYDRRRVAVIGQTIVREVFEGQNPIGEYFKINKVSFQVIGVLPSKGADAFRDRDDVIIIPVETAMKRLLGKSYVDEIELEIKTSGQIDKAQEDIESVMRARWRVPKDDESPFEIRNMAEIQEAISQTSQTMSLLLAIIAGVSLVVGGIGIMNIMLVSVTERTKEIGLRKAVGATRSDILRQFLIESVVISAFGGILGIICGWSIGLILATVSGWSVAFDATAAFGAMLFSMLVGIIFGIYPARKASALSPIDSMRYD